MFQTADPSYLPEFGIGHAQDLAKATGCTVFIAPEGASCGVDVRGGGPATRETDLLKPENMIQDVHAVVLSGGSAFGLESACGVAEELVGRNIGFKLANACVPIVPAACLFDLLIAQNAWPDKDMGREACRNAFESQGRVDIAQGNVGAGTGATVGKMGLPVQVMKSGFGWAGLELGGVVVIACTAVNACGNIMDERGNWIAGTLGQDGRVMDPLMAFAAAKAKMDAAAGENTDKHDGKVATESADESGGVVRNTTLGVVLTNADLSKAQATKVAQIAQDGYARAIKPVHTLGDGDTIFTLASRKVSADVNLVGIMAAEAMERAVRNAVLNTEGAYSMKAAKDLI